MTRWTLSAKKSELLQRSFRFTTRLTFESHWNSASLTLTPQIGTSLSRSVTMSAKMTILLPCWCKPKPCSQFLSPVTPRTLGLICAIDHPYNVSLQAQAKDLEGSVASMTAVFNQLDQRMGNVTSIATKFGDRLQVRTIHTGLSYNDSILFARSQRTLPEVPEITELDTLPVPCLKIWLLLLGS